MKMLIHGIMMLSHRIEIVGIREEVEEEEQIGQVLAVATEMTSKETAMFTKIMMLIIRRRSQI